jgi:hypothetical protein
MTCPRYRKSANERGVRHLPRQAEGVLAQKMLRIVWGEYRTSEQGCQALRDILGLFGTKNFLGLKFASLPKKLIEKS